jgi:hypothetical protein
VPNVVAVDAPSSSSFPISSGHAVQGVGAAMTTVNSAAFLVDSFPPKGGRMLGLGNSETDVLAAIRDMGMGHQVIFNKGAVMVLPPSVDKGTGLAAAFDELGLSPPNVVGIGDAENDHAFLQTCEMALVGR